jgi:hypothetical protein
VLGSVLASGVGAQVRKVMYRHGGPELGEELARALHRIGVEAVSVGGGEALRAVELGLGVYGDQLVGKGVLELREEQWQQVRREYLAGREAGKLVRPAVLAEPDVVVGLERKLTTRLGELRGLEGVVGVSLGDEVSVTRHANPLDLCFGERTLAEFRRWLRVRHGAIGELNRAWRSGFTDWDEVVPMTADQVRERELRGGELPRNLRPWAEHREFMDVELAQVVGMLARRASAGLAGVACGLTGLQPPSAYGGHDYARLVPLLGMYEAYDIGGARQLAMSLARVGAEQWITLFPPADGQPLDLVRARYAEAIARGVHGVVVWSSGLCFDAGGARTPYGEAVAGALRELEPAAGVFGGARVQFAPVWLLESQASVRAHWMLDSADDGATWVNRLSSYEAAHSTSLAARRSWVRLLQDLGLQPRFVAEAELADRLRSAPPLLLVLPAQLALGDPAVQAIRGYVQRGGCVVADHGAALYDEHLVRRPAGALDDLFGIRQRSARWSDLRVAQGRGLGDGRIAEAGLRAGFAEADPHGCVQIEQRAGDGRAIYLNLPVCEYAARRLAPGSHPFCVDLRQRIGWVLSQVGVAAPVAVRGTGLPTCIERVPAIARDGTELLAIRLNALDEPSLAQQLAAGGSRPVELTFAGPVELTDLLRGRRHGPATTLTVELDPWVGAFFAVRRP